MKIEEIAQVCQNVNRAYCQSLGDMSQPEWKDAPEWQKRTVIAGVLFHMMHPEAGPDASHQSWLDAKHREGWVYGEVKNVEAKTHPCMVPFNELPTLQQAKDFIFRAIVHELSEEVSA